MSVAVLLVAVAVGRAHPAGQICAQAKTLQSHAGSPPNKTLSDQATKDYSSLLKTGAPTCAVNALAEPNATGTNGSVDNVPANLSGLDRGRAYLTNLGLGTTEWVLVLLGALLLLRSVAVFIVSRRPGSVNLGSVTDAISEKAADAALSAQIHGRLAAHQLYGAPLAPGGGLPETVATTLKETNLPNTEWMASLIRILPDLIPKSGVMIDTVMRKRQTGQDNQGCTATLTDLSTGQVLTVFTVWENTPAEAADAAAIFAIAHILERDPICRRTPAWSRFGLRSEQALAELTRGDDSGSDAVMEAREHYRRALALDPGNLTIALKLGNAQELPAMTQAGEIESDDERDKQWVAAFKTYRRAYRLWPEALAPRYRAAVALLSCARREACRSELRSLDLGEAEQCRRHADSLLEDLVAALGWWNVTKRWLATFFSPRGRASGTRRYFQKLANPLSVKRLQLRATYEMARLAADNSPESRVEELLCRTFPASVTPFDRMAVNWQVRYNAACYYVRRAEQCAGEQDRSNAYLEKADALLVKALRDPRHQITGEWLRTDPDLKYYWSSAMADSLTLNASASGLDPLPV